MRQRRGLNLSFYVLEGGQKFVETRSIPRGKPGHQDRSASATVRCALGVYQWLILEGVKRFKRWNEKDWVIMLRCLPNAPLFTGENPDHMKRILAIPQIVETESKKLNLQRVMKLDEKVIPALIRRLKDLTPFELIALNDQLEVLRVEFLKNS